MDVIVIGEILIDFIPGTEEASYIRNPGGGPANAAVAMAKNGLSVGMYCKMGNDDFGRFLSKTMTGYGVKLLSPELTDEAVTTMAYVTLYPDGERSFTFSRKPGADMLLSRDELKDSDIDGAKLISAASFSMSKGPESEATVELMKRAHEKGKMVAFDINYRDVVWGSVDKCAGAVRGILPYVDFLKVSGEEIDMIGGPDAVPDVMKQYGITAVVYTKGSEGADCYFGGEILSVPGKKAKAVDATGCGDAFWGGFLSSVLNQGVEAASDVTSGILKKAIEYGNICGWFTVQKKGGMSSLPTKAQIEEVLSKTDK
ncbi:MAG TPA: carbohydrate kinase [Lachnospiraceae bacterium]|jgi:sugar/nucleoside kinase (ribokinase family)|nr:carbohydrate kinase [Lachnospiraceae bacterium]